MLFYILLAVIIVSLISLVGIFILLFNSRSIKNFVFYSISFAAGALLATAFLDLIPEASKKSKNIFWFVIAGILIFFVLEKFLHWYHCHEGVCDVHIFSYLSLFSDALHNFFDGVIIASTFMLDIKLGIITTISVVLHEIPQEIGDFSILIYGGFSTKKALLYNFLTALTAIAGALIAYFFINKVASLIPYLVGIAGGGFVYIAAADLLPEMHKTRELKKSIIQFLLLILGIITIGAAVIFLPA